MDLPAQHEGESKIRRRTRRGFIIATLAAIIGWWTRAIQFILFLAIAGIDRRLINIDAPDLGPSVREWAELSPPATVPPPTGSRCGITYHHWYHNFSPKAANRCLAEIAGLGAGYLRADIRWMDLLPDGTHLDANARDWYRNYLQVAQQWYGLTPIVVLSNPPKTIANLPDDLKISAWETYIDLAIANFGDLCRSYQLMNEINSPVFRFISPERLGSAITTAASRIRASLSHCELMINVMADYPGWVEDTQKYIAQFASAIDIVGIDFYPDTWSVSLGNPWKRVELGIARLRTTTPAKMRLAILETGYSTNIPLVRSERQQVEFYRHLRNTVQMLENQHGGTKLAHIALYEIIDQNSNIPLDPETHFGLLKSESFRRKEGYAEAQHICELFH